MTKLWQFWQGHPNPAFSEKVQMGDQEKFFKSRPKSLPRLKRPTALWRKWYYPLITTQLWCKYWRRFCAKSGSKSAQMVKLWQFSQGHPKPAFSEKVPRGNQGQFFKNRPKSSPCFKGPKALWRRSHYPVIKMHQYCKDRRSFWRKKAAPKVPKWQSHDNFGKVTQNPHSLKKCKDGTEGIGFFKILNSRSWPISRF